MTSMREKIAMRLIELYRENGGPLDGLTEADAILDALMEPTAGMSEGARTYEFAHFAKPGESMRTTPVMMLRQIFIWHIQSAKDGK